MGRSTSKEKKAQELEDERIRKLEAFGQSCAKSRDDAVEYKKELGCEEEWDEDDEHYNGIDDGNRKSKNTLKGRSTTDGLTEKQSKEHKSEIFDNITQYHVDLNASRAADMLTPTDDKPFKISPTPMQDLIDSKDDKTMIEAPGAEPAPASDIIAKMLEEAKVSAEKAETWIWDKLVECNWHAEFRKCIESAARIGTGVMKGPFPVLRKFKKYDHATNKLTVIEKAEPASKSIDPRNLFPGAGCGASIHDAPDCWERDKISAKKLRDLLKLQDEDGKPMYLASQIELCLEEGPSKKYKESAAVKRSDKDSFEIWYGYVTANRDDMEAAGCLCDEGAAIPAQITLVNERVIQATISPLDSGEFPYDVMVWKRKAGTWTGTGVARQVRDQQRLINAAERTMSNNAGLSSGPQIVVDLERITPVDKSLRLTPCKVWKSRPGVVSNRPMSDAIASIKIDSVQAEMLSLINFAIERADKTSQAPLTSQGQQGENAETLGGRLILQNNAGTFMRRVAKIADDDVIEPCIKRYYEYWLLYSEDGKGGADHQIEAVGSSTLYERDAGTQFLLQIGPYIKDPAFECSPAKWMTEMLKGNKIDPKRLQYTEDEKTKMQEAQAEAGPAVDPKIAGAKEVAEIRVKGEMEKAQLVNTSDVEELKLKAATARDTLNARALEAKQQREHDREMKNMEYQIRLMEFAESQKVSLDQAKVKLADTRMKLHSQEKLSGVGGKNGRPVPQVATPAIEPSGRAQPGRGFER